MRFLALSPLKVMCFPREDKTIHGKKLKRRTWSSIIGGIITAVLEHAGSHQPLKRFPGRFSPVTAVY